MQDLENLTDRQLQETQIKILRQNAKFQKSIKGWVEFLGWISIAGIIATILFIASQS